MMAMILLTPLAAFAGGYTLQTSGWQLDGVDAAVVDTAPYSRSLQGAVTVTKGTVDNDAYGWQGFIICHDASQVGSDSTPTHQGFNPSANTDSTLTIPAGTMCTAGSDVIVQVGGKGWIGGESVEAIIYDVTATPAPDPSATPAPGAHWQDTPTDECGGFLGIGCLVQWVQDFPSMVLGLFEPSAATRAAWDISMASWRQKVPFALVTAPLDLLSAATSTSCDTAPYCSSAFSFSYDSDGGAITVADAGSDSAAAQFAAGIRPLAGAAIYGGMFVGLAAWAWRRYAPGSGA